MIAAPDVEDISRQIVSVFAPRRIVLFGSRARGDARPDSDVDLLVEMSSDLAPADRIRAIDRIFQPRTWPLDVIVLTPEEVALSRKSRNSVVGVAEREGRILYERS
jgi:predicted nucleotidyltransferase